MNIIETTNLHGIARCLVHDQLLTHNQAILAQRSALATSLRFIRYLLINKLVPAEALALSVAKAFGYPYIDLNLHDQAYIDSSWPWTHDVIPLYQQNGIWYVAIDDPTDQVALNAFQFHIGCPVRLIIADSDVLYDTLRKIRAQKELVDLKDYVNSHELMSNSSVIQEPDYRSPVMQFIHNILQDAVRRGASDIHFEPYKTHYRVRLRLDGILHDVARPPQQISDNIANCIKVMSQLDITERRLPQDGRFLLNGYLPHAIDVRVSLCPTISGEKIVIRLLDIAGQLPTLSELGLTAQQKILFLDAINQPHGMILVTGPTGSGKTITLYALLNHLNTDHINISTVEDPVEIQLPGINQVQVNNHGLGFSETLKSFLRQDPDVMMIGEMRDLATAEIALKAALTGHLVLSTLHTNSAADTLARLMNIGLLPVHVASAVRLIVAQRLVRRLCDRCKLPVTDLTLFQKTQLNLSENKPHKIFRAIGCKECNDGYKGRLALFEIMPISVALEQHLLQHAPASTLHAQALTDGMQTLYQHGLEKVHAGLTTLEEILRVSSL